ncbi:TPA: bssS family protein [Yersinia enterocolitica]|nr:bssS family protein [Yersinia enterocolitica]HDL6985197.1 bssS family protein [Yersinia enterocolitica]HDL7067739.1 bssS family protein [Yersinia enterocolitica]HDL7072127.1 bssS family protein [Yersinia enterocolitica]
MSKKDDIPVFPVTGWQAGPLPGHDMLILKFQFLSSPMQKLDEAQESQFYAMQPAMVRNLISDLTRHLEALEKYGVQFPPGKKH